MNTSLIKSLQKEIENLKKCVGNYERTLKFYKIENKFFRDQTTKRGRKITRDAKVSVDKQVEMKRILNEDIFPFHKFPGKEKLKDLSLGSIGIEVMSKLRISHLDWPEFWAWNHEIVEKCFTDYRSGALMQMKDAFKKGKFLTYILLQNIILIFSYYSA